MKKPTTEYNQTAFSQDAFAPCGLLANLVAGRVARLDNPADRGLIWFIQLLSHRDGGLKKVTSDLLTRYPERFATPAMQAIKPGHFCAVGQVKAIRSEIPQGEDRFLLRGEVSAVDAVTLPEVPSETEDIWHGGRTQALQKHAESNRRANANPQGYAIEDFRTACRETAQAELPKYLSALCLNPGLSLDAPGPWYFPALVPTLREFMAAHIEALKVGAVVTAPGKQVANALDYALETRSLAIIDGPARFGKTHAARAWCEQHPGQARYVQVPGASDEMAFLRAIARGVGTTESPNMKACALRQRIEDALQDGGLMLVLDEAHYLIPSRWVAPRRAIWVMTALVNKGLPVALVTTPQFFGEVSAVTKKRVWNFSQFEGRIGHFEKLPEEMPTEDLEAVAGAHLPEGSPKAIRALAAHAKLSSGYLGAIEAVAKRARFIATRESRAKITDADIAKAMQESKSIGSALTTALHYPGRAASRSSSTAAPAPGPAGASQQASPARCHPPRPSVAVAPPHAGERQTQPAEPETENSRLVFTP